MDSLERVRVDAFNSTGARCARCRASLAFVEYGNLGAPTGWELRWLEGERELRPVCASCLKRGGAERKSCSFCGEGAGSMRVANPAMHCILCINCLRTAERVLAGGVAGAPIQRAPSNSGLLCSFCGRPQFDEKAEPMMISEPKGDEVVICRECLALARELMGEEPSTLREP